MTLSDSIAASARTLAGLTRNRPRPTLAVVLGSAFGEVAHTLSHPRTLSFAQIPGFAKTTVPGHQGSVIHGFIGDHPIWLISGRLHYYEGHSMAQITFPIRVLAHLKVDHILLTNAAGTLNPKHPPGDFLRITDHINFMGDNPLRGHEGSDRFVDLSQVYDPTMARLLDRAARQTKVRLHKGVYLSVSGPSYETPAEIRTFRKWGADAVGMSTVPEAIIARQCGMRVAGLSCLTNWAAGMGRKPITHEEVLAMSQHRTRQASDLLATFVQMFHEEEGTGAASR